MEELEFRRHLREAQAGDGNAFGELYVLVTPRIRGFLQSRGAEDADGLTNEVMLRVFRSIDGFQGSQQAFVGWVFQIARNALIDEVRRRDRRPKHVDDFDLDGRPDPIDIPIEQWEHSQDESERLSRLLSHLSRDQADIITMRAIAGLSYDEIAAATGKRVGAVRATYARGRAALESLMELEALRQRQITGPEVEALIVESRSQDA